MWPRDYTTTINQPLGRSAEDASEIFGKSLDVMWRGVVDDLEPILKRVDDFLQRVYVKFARVDHKK